MISNAVWAMRADATEDRFTGKERDTESGNDYFEARYYGSAMGRFMSPDWASAPMPVPYASLFDPQSLNLYSYVHNNPLSGVDADGHLSCKDAPGLCAQSEMPGAPPLFLLFLAQSQNWVPRP